MIETEQQLERALAEFQELRAAPDGSPGARRRADLDADIKAFYVQRDRYSRRDATDAVDSPKPLHSDRATE